MTERLGAAPASVPGMIQRLPASKPLLILYRRHLGVTLTRRANGPLWKSSAITACRKPISCRRWVTDEVHKEAEGLEHVISEDFEARIANALGDPARDPHGDPIPSAELTLPADDSLPLSALRPPQKAVIARVNGEDPAFLRHLEDLGLVPGARVQVKDYSAFDNNITIKVGSQAASIVGLPITSKIYTEVR